MVNTRQLDRTSADGLPRAVCGEENGLDAARRVPSISERGLADPLVALGVGGGFGVDVETHFAPPVAESDAHRRVWHNRPSAEPGGSLQPPRLVVLRPGAIDSTQKVKH